MSKQDTLKEVKKFDELVNNVLEEVTYDGLRMKAEKYTPSQIMVYVDSEDETNFQYDILELSRDEYESFFNEKKAVSKKDGTTETVLYLQIGIYDEEEFFELSAKVLYDARLDDYILDKEYDFDAIAEALICDICASRMENELFV